MQLAKPGMGVDEALTIVGNEQARFLALLRAKNARRG
jgi:methylaspartate ammonia-lyase